MPSPIRIAIAAASILVVASCVGGLTQDTDPATVAAPAAAPANPALDVVADTVDEAEMVLWAGRAVPLMTEIGEDMSDVGIAGETGDIDAMYQALDEIEADVQELLADPCPVPEINDPLSRGLDHYLTGVIYAKGGLAASDGDLILRGADEWALATPLMDEATNAVLAWQDTL